MSKFQTLKEKKEYIIKILEVFFGAVDLSYIRAELNKAETIGYISVTKILDEYLAPHIHDLYKRKNTTNVLFTDLLPLCFKGDLSLKTWNKIWDCLSEDEKIDSTTKYNYLGFPLVIAAKEGNIRALEKLDETYYLYINKHPDRLSPMHSQLLLALIEISKLEYNEKNEECYRYLFNMCYRYTSLIDTKSDINDFSNRQFHFKITGVCLTFEETTPALTAFAMQARDEQWKNLQEELIDDAIYLDSKPSDCKAGYTSLLLALKDKMDDFSTKKINDPKYFMAHKAAFNLYRGLRKEGNLFFNKAPTEESYKNFKTATDDLIKVARPTLTQHRGWTKILANIAAFVLTAGIGYLLAYGVATAVNKGRRPGFFATDSAQKIDALEDFINQETIQKGMGK